MNSILLSSLIVSICMLPLAYQDWKKQEVHGAFVLFSVLSSIACMFVFSTVATPLNVAFVIIGLVFTVFSFKKITYADFGVAMFSIPATVYTGTLSFLVVILAAIFHSIFFRTKRKKKYPFLTIYAIAMLVISLSLLTFSALV